MAGVGAVGAEGQAPQGDVEVQQALAIDSLFWPCQPQLYFQISFMPNEQQAGGYRQFSSRPAPGGVQHKGCSPHDGRHRPAGKLDLAMFMAAGIRQSTTGSGSPRFRGHRPA